MIMAASNFTAVEPDEDRGQVDRNDWFRDRFTWLGQEDALGKGVHRTQLLHEKGEQEEAASVVAEVPPLRQPATPPAAPSALPPEAPSVTPPLDQQAQQILRTHLIEPIIADLRHLERHTGEAIAAMYASSVLGWMRTMRDLSPTDPYLEVVMALHDALAFQNRWTEFAANQYAGAVRILRDLAGKQRLATDQVEKAIMCLEELGFDTTPCGSALMVQGDAEVA